MHRKLNIFFLLSKTFDGVKLFLPKQITEKSIEFEAKNLEDGNPVKISIHYKRKLDLCDRNMIQQFNILFKRIFNVLKFKMHNRNFYDPQSAHAIKQHNLSVWPGYVTAVDRFEGGLFLQCDVSHRVLRTETVRDLLMSLKKRGGDLKTEAEKALLGASVLTRYGIISVFLILVYISFLLTVLPRLERPRLVHPPSARIA